MKASRVEAMKAQAAEAQAADVAALRKEIAEIKALIEMLIEAQGAPAKPAPRGSK